MPVLLPRAAAGAILLMILAALLPFGVLASLAVCEGLLLLVLAVDFAMAPSPGRFSVARELPASAVLGVTSPLGWVVSSRFSRRVKVHLADGLAPSLRSATRRVTVVVGAGATSSASTEFRPQRRGDFAVTELVVRTEGPLGVAGRQARRRIEDKLRVLPTFQSRREAELRMDRARILEVGVRSARFHGGGSDFDRMREYTTDDESRRIDWAATARAGKPIVRTYRAERNQNVTLLLDAGRLMAAQIDGVARLEHALDAAMCITSVAARLGDRVGLVAFDRRVRTVLAPGEPRHQLRRVVDAVYRLEPQLVETDFRTAFLEMVTRQRRRSLVVLITDLAEQAVEDTLSPALPVLRNHLVVIGAVRDPQVDSWAAAAPAAPEGAYRRAAALESLERRRRLAARFGRIGATVVDEPPSRLAAALTDFYLDVKAAGRL